MSELPAIALWEDGKVAHVVREGGQSDEVAVCGFVTHRTLTGSSLIAIVINDEGRLELVDTDLLRFAIVGGIGPDGLPEEGDEES